MSVTYPEVFNPDWAKYDMPVTYSVLYFLLTRQQYAGSYLRRESYRRAASALKRNHSETGQHMYTMSDGVRMLIEAAHEVGWLAPDKYQPK